MAQTSGSKLCLEPRGRLPSQSPKCSTATMSPGLLVEPLLSRPCRVSFPLLLCSLQGPIFALLVSEPVHSWRGLLTLHFCVFLF